MKKLMKVLKIGLVALVVMIGVSMIFSPKIAKYFQHKYYNSTYEPEEISNDAVKSYPPHHRINGIPWISYRKLYSQPALLQMVARKHGIREDLGYFNFLIGFTYGAIYRNGMDVFSPYTDYASGFKEAAPYLGLKMRCLTTNDSNVFLKTVRSYISRGYPVAVELDAAKLWKEGEISPRIELLIGYDKDGFEYFEPGKENRFKAWSRGLRVSDVVLSEAVISMTDNFLIPWKFAFIVFEKAAKKDDIKEVWSKNGNALVGKKVGPLAYGSLAISQFARRFKGTRKIKDIKLMEAAAYTRIDNAKFLRSYFPHDKEIKKAASLFAEAGSRYKKILNMVEKGVENKQQATEVSDLLINAASLEKEAGEIFLQQGKN